MMRRKVLLFLTSFPIMNRIDRIAAILIQLQSRRIVKGQDIADRFHISLRTVYRDIKTLEEAGVPIIGEPGTGYTLMDGYRLPPVMFSREEATSFLPAEKLMEKFTDPSTFKLFESALLKIKAVLRSDDKEHLDVLNDSIVVISNPNIPERNKESDFLQQILRSISSKCVLQITYFANHSQQQSSREIEPVGIIMMSGKWYTVAYCRWRKAYRHFKVERIRAMNETKEHFGINHPPLQNFINELKHADTTMHEVMLRFDKTVMRYLGEQKYYSGFVAQRDLGDQIEMQFLTPSLEGILRWYLMFLDHAEIVSPSALKERAKAFLTAGIKKLDSY